MTGFDLPQNFHSDPESLLRRMRARLISPWRSLSAVDPVISSSSAPRAMAQKTLRDYSAPSANQIPTGPRLTPEGKILRSRWVSLRWCRPALFVARPMTMTALISNSSWSSAVLLLSRVYHKMQSGSVCFRSLSWGERSNGFTLTRLLWTLGTKICQGVPREVLPDRQNQCSSWTDFELPAGIK